MSRNGRLIVGIVVVFGIILFIFFAPVVPIKSTNLNFGGFSANQQTWGSISYLAFKCGEVHASGSSTVNGNAYASSDQYLWSCGQNG